MSAFTVIPGEVVYEGQSVWWRSGWPPFVGENDTIPVAAGVLTARHELVGGPYNGHHATIPVSWNEIIVPGLLSGRYRYIRDRKHRPRRPSRFWFVEAL